MPALQPARLCRPTAETHKCKISMKLLSRGSTKLGGGKVITALPAVSFLTARAVLNYWCISERTLVRFSRFIFVPEYRIAPCNPESELGNEEEGSLESTLVSLTKCNES